MKLPLPSRKFFIIFVFFAFTVLVFTCLSSLKQGNGSKNDSIRAFSSNSPSTVPNYQGTNIPITASTTEEALQFISQKDKNIGAAAKTAITNFQASAAKLQADIEKPQYGNGDIKLSGNTDTESLKKYGNDAANIIFKYGAITPAYDERSGELPIIIAGGKGKDFSKLSELKTFAEYYKSIIKALLALAVPEPLSVQHLSLINSYASLLLIDENLSLVQSEPGLGIIAIGEYPNAQKRFLDSLKAISAVYKEKGVVFSPNESGSFFAAQENKELYPPLSDKIKLIKQ